MAQLSPDSIGRAVCRAGGDEVPTFQVADEGDCGEAGSYYIERYGNVYEAHACPSTCHILDEPGASVYASIECFQ